MKTIKKSIVGIAAAAMLLAGGWLNTAQGAMGSVDMTFTFKGIVILHYYSNLNLTFNAVDQAADENVSSPGAEDLAANVTFDAAMTPGGMTAGIPDTVTITVENVWAVRGLTSSGNIRVDPNITSAKATNGTSSVTISNLQAQTSSVAAGDPITVAAPGLARSRAVFGDIVFDLDLTNVTATGPHSGAQYTITATAI